MCGYKVKFDLTIFQVHYGSMLKTLCELYSTSQTDWINETSFYIRQKTIKASENSGILQVLLQKCVHLKLHNIDRMSLIVALYGQKKDYKHKHDYNKKHQEKIWLRRIPFHGFQHIFYVLEEKILLQREFNTVYGDWSLHEKVHCTGALYCVTIIQSTFILLLYNC